MGSFYFLNQQHDDRDAGHGGGEIAEVLLRQPLDEQDAQLQRQEDNGQTEDNSEGQAIQFRPELFPTNLGNLPDYQPIHDLLIKSQYGIRFYDKELYENLLQLMEEFDQSTFTRRIICLLQMLDQLCSCNEYKLLSETPYNMANHLEGESEPINKVYTYLYNHFKEDIRLEEIANYVGQNPTALCRYFKLCARKSIFQCLAEIRISHSAKLLVSSKINISQIVLKSGYNTQSHFITQFKTIMGRTPSEYREQIHK